MQLALAGGPHTAAPQEPAALPAYGRHLDRRHSGIGGEHIEPTIGEYQLELLNALLSRLIVQALQDE